MWNGYTHSVGWRNWIGKRIFTVLQPLCFDQSLSYYEQVAHFAHKLNELINAVNSQNVTIQDFIAAVTTEIDDFELRVSERQDEFETEMLRQFEEYKEQINQIIDEFKTEMRTEWELYKNEINAWRDDMVNQWELYKADLTAQWVQFKQDWLSTWETYKQSINERMTAHERLVQAQLDEYRQDLTEFKTEVQTQLDEMRQDQSDFERNLLITLTNWMTETTSTLRAEFQQWETSAYASLKAYIDQQIGGYVASLSTQITMLSNELGAERGARILGDEGLQTQIDQLTPEGAIKADAPDADGNSQLYIIDKTTQEREDIYPKVNQNDIQFNVVPLKNVANSQYNGAVNSKWIGFNSTYTRGNGPWYFTDLIKIPLSQIEGDSPEIKGYNFTQNTYLITNIWCDNDWSNYGKNLRPQLSLSNHWADQDYAYATISLTIEPTLGVDGDVPCKVYYKLMYANM